MDLSCAFATSMDTPEHIVLAEELGFTRAWCYDSPALYPDVWTILGLAAVRTQRIGLGPAVLVPSLRHPMTNAAAIATLEALAPGRIAVAIGAGFTGRMVLGQRPLPWSQVGTYVRALRGYLRGDETEWEGRWSRMMHDPAFGAARPVEVPILIGAEGRRGQELALELGDGIFSSSLEAHPSLPWHAMVKLGTILEDDEDPASPRVLDSAGAALAMMYHSRYARGGRDAVRELPGGDAWADGVEAHDEPVRHLAVHEGHLVRPNERDRRAWAAGSHALLPKLPLVGTAAAVRASIQDLADAGVREIAYQPSGSDIPRELRAFAAAALDREEGST